MDFLLFASSSLARRAGGPHLPGRVGLACLPRGGRATGSRTDARPDRPILRDPRREARLGAGAPRRGLAGSAAEARGRAGFASPAAPAGEGKEGRGEVFIQECASELLLFPHPPFLKAKAIIYRPFRFAECSLFELDIQTPPKGAGGAGVEKRRPRLGRPCAAAGPGAPPCAPGTQNARPSFDSKAQICPPPPTHTPPSFRGLILRPPRPPPPFIKGLGRSDCPRLV